MKSDKKHYKEIFKDFIKCNPEYKSLVYTYRPWGRESIVVWLINGCTYKCKRRDKDRFTIQELSKEDIINKIKNTWCGNNEV